MQNSLVLNDTPRAVFLLNELSATAPEVKQKIGSKNNTRRSKKISRRTWQNRY